jgi:amino acid adenylation domain-containing protein
METEVQQFESSNLTRSQFLMWMGQAITPDTPLYNMAIAFDLGVGIDPEQFSLAFQRVVDANDALRLVFNEVDGVPQQRVLDCLTNTMEVVDMGTEQRDSPIVVSWLEQRSKQMLPLANCSFDAVLLRLRDDHWLWFLNQHHLTTDAWSVALVYRRTIEEYYNCEVEPSPAFTDYISTEQRLSSSPGTAEAVAHWQNHVVSSKEQQVAGFYGRKPHRGSTETGRTHHLLDLHRSNKLREMAEAADIRSFTTELSLFNIFLTLMFVFLHRAGERNTLRLGAPIHNRTTKKFRETIGLFIEVFPLEVTISEGETFSSLLGKVREESHSFLLNGQVGSSSAATNASYDALLNFITASFPQVNGLEPNSEWIHSGHGDIGHSFRLQVHDFDGQDQFALHFDLNQEVFPQELQDLVVQQFCQLLDAMLDNRHQPLSEISLLSGADHMAWDMFNDSNMALPSTAILQDITEWSEAEPQRIALQENGRELSYRGLETRSNYFAKQLQARGVKAGEVVGLALPRSIDLVVMVMAVLKTGAAYLPMDPRSPVERQQGMLADTGVRILFCEKATSVALQNVTTMTVADLEPESDIDTEYRFMEGDSLTESGLSLEINVQSTAYIMFTSGSTGKPKGVEVRHRALAAYVRWARSVYMDGDVPPGGWVMPLFTSFSFDLTITSLFLPLSSGGRLIIYPEDNSATDLAVLRVIEENRVNLIKLTPAHLSLVRELNPRSSRIRRMVLGGENLRTELAHAVTESIGGLEIFNEYGPTEATVGCMVHRFDPQHDQENFVPIGRPAKHMRVYVLDEQLRRMPRKAIGEIYLSGAGLAAGYCGLDEQTRERFIDDPFVPEQKMYRSGDLGSLGQDGVLRFHGRIDEQLKIGGMRVEPGEVESALQLQGLNEVVVVASHEDIATKAPRSSKCVRCGLPANVPDTHLDKDGVCQLCLDFEIYRERAMTYFSNMDEFQGLAERVRSEGTGQGLAQDCIVLLSGGKDSTYMLYQLVEYGLTPLVFCLDNGFVSDGAKDNIRRAVDDLGLELVFGETPAMNEVFVDSLKTFSNVCNGCFKVIYTLATALAEERGIGYIVTGLSRGQIFDTRLKELFQHKTFDVEQIDSLIIDARRAYHRMDDVVSQRMDTSVFDDDQVFDRVKYIDFYRYCDIELADLYQFLDQKAPWVRPKDTGRSTNCLINDVGIWIHKNERGYHNYAEPYSWDVRLGHKQRDAALAELDDEIDVSRVRNVMDEIGYREIFSPATERASLVAYYVGDEEINVRDTRQALAEQIPEHMIPGTFIRLDSMPLTSNGKVDRAALPTSHHGSSYQPSVYVAPGNPTEEILVSVWSALLDHEEIGINDDYIELGGDSILSIQIASRARDQGLAITPRDIFEHATIAALARVARPLLEEPIVPSSTIKPSELDKIANLLKGRGLDG